MRILIVDNNVIPPLNHCIDFRRFLNGFVEVRRAPDQDLPKESKTFSHIIVSGSKTSCLDSSKWVCELLKFLERAVENKIKILGVCYGHQLLIRLFGGTKFLQKADQPEIGWVEIEQTAQSTLLQGLPKKFTSFQSHFEEAQRLPSGLVLTAKSKRCGVQSFYHQSLPIYGIQFHPEKNFEEGKKTIQMFKNKLNARQQDCIFHPTRAVLKLNHDDVGATIFRNFLGSTN